MGSDAHVNSEEHRSPVRPITVRTNSPHFSGLATLSAVASTSPSAATTVKTTVKTTAKTIPKSGFTPMCYDSVSSEDELRPRQALSKYQDVLLREQVVSPIKRYPTAEVHDSNQSTSYNYRSAAPYESAQSMSYDPHLPSEYSHNLNAIPQHSLVHHDDDRQIWSYNHKANDGYYNDGYQHAIYPPSHSDHTPTHLHSSHPRDPPSSVPYVHDHQYKDNHGTDDMRWRWNKDADYWDRPPPSHHVQPASHYTPSDWHEIPNVASNSSIHGSLQHHSPHYSSMSHDYAPPHGDSYPPSMPVYHHTPITYHDQPSWRSAQNYNPPYYSHDYEQPPPPVHSMHGPQYDSVHHSRVHRDSSSNQSPREYTRSADFSHDSQPSSNSMIPNHAGHNQSSTFSQKPVLKQTKLPLFLNMQSGHTSTSSNYGSFPTKSETDSTLDTNCLNSSSSSLKSNTLESSNYPHYPFPNMRVKPKAYIVDDLDQELMTTGFQLKLAGLTPLTPSVYSPAASSITSNSSTANLSQKSHIRPALIIDLLSTFQFLEVFGVDFLHMKIEPNFSFGWVVDAMIHPEARYCDILWMFSHILNAMESDVPKNQIMLQAYVCEYIRVLMPKLSEELYCVDLPLVSPESLVAIMTQFISWLTETDAFHQHLSDAEAFCTTLRKSCLERAERIHQYRDQCKQLKVEMSAVDLKIEFKTKELERGTAPEPASETMDLGPVNTLVAPNDTAADYSVPENISNPSAVSEDSAKPLPEHPVPTAAPALSTNSSSRASSRKHALVKSENDREYVTKLKEELMDLQKMYNAHIDNLDRHMEKLNRLETLNSHDRRRVASIVNVSKGSGDVLLGVDRYGSAYWWVVVEGGDATLDAVNSVPFNHITGTETTTSLEHFDSSSTSIASAQPKMANFGILVEHDFSAHEDNDPSLIAEASTGWSYFTSLADIYSFLTTLCNRGFRERALRSTLLNRFSNMGLPPSYGVEEDFTHYSRATFDKVAAAVVSFGVWIRDVTGAPLPFTTDTSDRVMHISNVMDRGSPQESVLATSFTDYFGGAARHVFNELISLCRNSAMKDSDVDINESFDIQAMKSQLMRWFAESKLDHLTSDQLNACHSIATLSHFHEWCTQIISEITETIVYQEETAAAQAARKKLEAQKELARTESAIHFTRSGRRVAPPNWSQGLASGQMGSAIAKFSAADAPQSSEVSASSNADDGKSTTHPNFRVNQKKTKANLSKPTKNKMDLPESTKDEMDLPESTKDEMDLPESIKDEMDLPESTKDEMDLPESIKDEMELPESTEDNMDLPEPTEGSVDLSELTEDSMDLPESTKDEMDLPESTKDEMDLSELTKNSFKKIIPSMQAVTIEVRLPPSKATSMSTRILKSKNVKQGGTRTRPIREHSRATTSDALLTGRAESNRGSSRRSLTRGLATEGDAATLSGKSRRQNPPAKTNLTTHSAASKRRSKSRHSLEHDNVGQSKLKSESLINANNGMDTSMTDLVLTSASTTVPMNTNARKKRKSSLIQKQESTQQDNTVAEVDLNTKGDLNPSVRKSLRIRHAKPL
ncbi:hypothetical protein O5D80_002405 [Batrachochytrium dendrobatidis]|nr:hypothetical protein O5D80_002405 [Batrachochytrium dendrobatidis]